MAENEKFEVGETVCLKSGGPTMTVNRLVPMADGTAEIATVWFDAQGKEMHGRFRPATLRRYDGPHIA